MEDFCWHLIYGCSMTCHCSMNVSLSWLLSKMLISSWRGRAFFTRRYCLVIFTSKDPCGHYVIERWLTRIFYSNHLVFAFSALTSLSGCNQKNRSVLQLLIDLTPASATTTTTTNPHVAALNTLDWNPTPFFLTLLLSSPSPVHRPTRRSTRLIEKNPCTGICSL